ncbi:hypothetical protein [Microcystis sp. M53598_WE2]|uniref:hypothetical protein n=1 Tax=Microcystis sp. M53598_WE2 TaxID=3030677 RepID=UPI00258D696D|nr:hypothetical protein [Microcystis sp. M53598_WE2]
MESISVIRSKSRLAYLPGGGFWGEANAVSGDGSVIVGFSDSANGLEAFRWTQATGMVGLGDLPGGGFGSFAFGASQDGSVVVGLREGASGQRAFIWDATNGMRDLQEVLVNDFGLDLTGWHLSNARAISADGLTIAGSGGNPNGQFDPHSAPSTVTLKILSKSSKRLPALNYRLICLPSRCTIGAKNLIALIPNY